MSRKFNGLRNSYERKIARKRRALERFSLIPHDDTMMSADAYADYILRKNVELQSLRHSLGM